MGGILLCLSWAESPALLPGKSSPSCGQLKDFEGQDMSCLFPSWPSKRPQGCLALCFGGAKSWRSSAISCCSCQSSLWRPPYHTRYLLEFCRNVCLVLPLTSGIIMFRATKGHQNPQREAGCCPGAHLQPGLVSPVLPYLRRRRKQPLSCPSGFAALPCPLLEHVNSLPSTLPQRPHLPNLLFLFIPFMVLQLVHIFLVDLVPHPGERLLWGPH